MNVLKKTKEIIVYRQFLNLIINVLEILSLFTDFLFIVKNTIKVRSSIKIKILTIKNFFKINLFSRFIV